MSNIDKQALRERYSEKPAPKCHICGSVMTIQRAGAGSVVYGCTGRIDKDGESYKFAEGRDFADDHYARSRVTDYGPGGDPDVLALLDELEAAESLAKQQGHIAVALFDELTTLRRNADDKAPELRSQLEEAEKRIAELEASHNNLREAMAGIHNTIAGGGAYTPLAAILNASKRAYEESAAAAGKGE